MHMIIRKREAKKMIKKEGKEKEEEELGDGKIRNDSLATLCYFVSNIFHEHLIKFLYNHYHIYCQLFIIICTYSMQAGE